MSSKTTAALARLLTRFVEHSRRTSAALPTTEHDPRWPSPCQVGDPDATGRIHWQPIEREIPADFGGLERALDVTLHPDVKCLYGSFWSDSLPLEAEEGALTLIQVWNDDDFDRLVGNVIGHALAKRRARAALTVFIATTEEGELMLSIENETGRIVLEEPGSAPIREVSPTLAQFLDRLAPVTDG